MGSLVNSTKQEEITAILSNLFQKIDLSNLRGHDYPNIKASDHKNENFRSVSLISINAKIVNKTLPKHITHND
jgi:hypothetical protein